MPKTNKERLQDNNTALLRIKGKAENLPPAGGSSEPNIFVQLEEPTTKDGIWLQTNKTAEHYISDDNIFIGGTWALDNTIKDIPDDFSYRPVTSIGTNIYLMGTNNDNKPYVYDVLTNTYTQSSSDMPYGVWGGSVQSIGTDIYLIGGGRR